MTTLQDVLDESAVAFKLEVLTAERDTALAQVKQEQQQRVVMHAEIEGLLARITKLEAERDSAVLRAKKAEAALADMNITIEKLRVLYGV
ncbi:MAG: hypothetical protein WC505_06005 [Patescibacteria group bacterium]